MTATCVCVVDVLRAFTTAHVAFARGASRILLAPDAEAAFALRDAEPARVLVGETGGYAIEGFDYGNSPTALEGAELAGATVVLKTTRGVPASLRAVDEGAGRVFVAGLATARHTAAYAAREGLALRAVPSDPEGDDDRAVCDYLTGAIDVARCRARIRASAAARKFLDPAQPAFPAADLDFALREAREPMVMEVQFSDTPFLVRIP